MTSGLAWTPDLIRRVVELRANLVSAAAIARQTSQEFGVSITKCMVLGVLHSSGVPKLLSTSPWTPERTARLRELIAAGTTYPVAARELGVSTQAAHNKGLRLKLRSVAQENAVHRQVEAKREARAKIASVTPGPDGTYAPRVSAPAPLSLSDYPHAVDLFGLRTTTCRYPVGEVSGVGQMFCGAYAEVSDPYCPGCAKRAFTGTVIDREKVKRLARLMERAA